jgi:hypothetical protein
MWGILSGTEPRLSGIQREIKHTFLACIERGIAVTKVAVFLEIIALKSCEGNILADIFLALGRVTLYYKTEFGGRGLLQCLYPLCFVWNFYVSLNTRKYRMFNLKRNALIESTNRLFISIATQRPMTAPRSAILSTTHHRADDINCYIATDDGPRPTVLNTLRHRADDINCCTPTDDCPRSTVLSTARHRADDINCCTATDDGPRPTVLSTARHRADDINCCTVTGNTRCSTVAFPHGKTLCILNTNILDIPY